jgi:archaellum component FlaG (FlaF/FlaG flagellin family)
MARTLKPSSYVLKTATYSARKEDELILANGTFTITLYQANTNPGHTLLIKNIGTGTITIAGNATAEKIDGSNTTALTSLQSTSLFNDGGNWWKTTVAASANTAALLDDGNSGSSKTIDWNAGTGHLLTLTANCTLTFANATDGGRYLLLLNSGTGGFLTFWPANVKWGPGGQPLNTQIPSKIDLFTAIYAATANQFYMSYSLGY